MPDPSKFTFPRLKQYVAVQDLKPNSKENWKKGELIHIDPEKHRPYVAARLIVPLDTALRQGIYVPEPKKTTSQKIKEAVIGKEEKEEDKPEAKTETASHTPTSVQTPEPAKTSESGGKTLIGNTLRDAVQAKKAETASAETPDTKKVDEAKLAAIKSGGKK